jgi:hypothetical protein
MRHAAAGSPGRPVMIVVALALLAGSPAVGQVPIGAPPQVPVQPPPQQQDDSLSTAADSILRHRAKGDSVRPQPPISPGTAFLRSLLLPGWGQAALGRNVTGGVFLTFEGIAVTMVWKSSWQLDYARTRQKYVNSHSQEKQDWIVLLVFNHLMAGAEAYVSAHLWDFPAALKMQALPGGRAGVGVSVRF